MVNMKAKGMISGLMLVLAVVACQHEEPVRNIIKNQCLKLSATIDNDTEPSRSNVTDDGYFTWASGDAISVYTTSSEFKDFVISESDGVGTSKANFEGQLDDGVSVSTCAVYPAFSGEGGYAYDAEGNSITLQLRETYDLGDNTENTNALMLALIGEDKSNLLFRHVGGVMRFVLQDVPEGASEFIFKALDKGITGSFVLDLDDDVLQVNARTYEEGETVEGNIVSVKFTSLTESRDLKFYIPLPLGEYHGFTIQVRNESGAILYERTSSATNTIKLRTLTKMPAITLSNVVEVKTAEALSAALNEIADVSTAINLADDAVNVETIDIPTSLTDTQEQAELNLIYGDLPANEVTIKATGDSSSTENEDGLGRLQISIPQSESDEAPSFNIDLPTMTVTLSASIESATFGSVTSSTAENTLIVDAGVTIKNLIVKKGNVRVKKGGVINSISTTETNETIYVIYEEEVPVNVQNTENLQHITAEYWESASDGAIYSEGEVIMLKSGSLKKVLGDDRLNIASLKVVGKINGDDICCLREMAGRDAYQNKTEGKLENLDLSEASIIEGGSYYYKSSTLSCYTAKDVIGERMFENCNLKEVQLPQGLLLIEAWAFYGCNKLESAAIYDKVTSIKDGAFSSCSALSSVNIPSSVEEIGFQAFVNCSNLKQVELPDGLKRLGGGAFGGCGLTSIVIPNSVESVGSELLAGCKSLTTVTLSAGLGYIGDGMFKDCTGVRSIDIPDGIHTIGNSAFEGCTQLYDVSIPKSVTTIRDYAFQNCDVLAQITLPENLEKISSYLFYGCDQLWSVNIPDGVDEIGREAFSNCLNLKTIEIPSSVKTIGYSAFFYSSLTGKIIIPGSVETIGGGAFGSTSLSEIEMEEGIKVIGNGAFSATNIKKITIPESVETIEAYAFRECSQLINAFILGPTEISPNVFYKCSELESIKFYSLTPSEKSDTSMGGVAFNNPPCELYVPANAYDAYYKIYGNSGFTIATY